MPNILIVEDDAEKLRRVMAALLEIPQCDRDKIQNVRDVAEAKRHMMSKRYDLLILDIAIPERPDALPTRDGGIRLLEELMERDQYQVPFHIVGLTAFQEVLDQAGTRFAEDLWLVILYDALSDSWSNQLKSKVRHIVLAQNSTSPAEYGVQLCLVTALFNPELKAVIDSVGWNFSVFERPNDPTPYYRGSYKSGDKEHQVIAGCSSRMGMASAAVLTMKMIMAFRPKYIAMPGILAGVRGSCNMGDIIVADPGWDYGSGKIQEKKSASQDFLPAPYQSSLNSFLRGKFALMANDDAALDQIRREWKGPKPENALRMHIGPVASGASVVANKRFLDEVIKQHRKLVGVEMETYGVFTAAEESPFPTPKAFSIKSVSDFADEAKDDSFREYAAFTSASALKYFVERYLESC